MRRRLHPGVLLAFSIGAAACTAPCGDCFLIEVRSAGRWVEVASLRSDYVLPTPAARLQLAVTRLPGDEYDLWLQGNCFWDRNERTQSVDGSVEVEDDHVLLAFDAEVPRRVYELGCDDPPPWVEVWIPGDPDLRAQWGDCRPNGGYVCFEFVPVSPILDIGDVP